MEGVKRLEASTGASHLFYLEDHNIESGTSRAWHQSQGQREFRKL